MFDSPIENADDEDRGDLGFERQLELHHGLPEPGDYVIEVLVNRGIRLTRSSSGAVLLWFCIRFIEGPPRGRELQLPIVIDGPPAMSLLVRRGLQVLDVWRCATGTLPAPGYVSLLRDIARNSRRTTTIATLGRAVTTRGGIIPALLKIRVDGARR